ncbi:MAG: hypothetical protein WA047_03425 [Phenylobacterium sp.]|uniref:hypothetical protein n=1 Tax=Phenylobacterium sp. TaxID=1871053 RepID=UPI003BB6241E
MNRIAKISLALTALVSLSAVSQPAAADGFLAGLARDAGLINEEQRAALDNAHTTMGNPLDRAATQIADAYVPGLGTGYNTIRGMNIGAPAPGGFAPPPPPPPQVRYGAVCVSPYGTAFLGQAPVGTPCTVFTPFGPAAGSIQ